jgi:hypothetical protein
MSSIEPKLLVFFFLKKKMSQEIGESDNNKTYARTAQFNNERT